MQCPRCQHENPQHAKFCLECGARLALSCAKCGAELPGSAKFCLECGEPVAQLVRPHFTSPESYTPKHLAEKILTSKSALEGERKLVTILFADLKGSMELLADRDPEEARKLLDPVLEHMMEAVHRYEGTVNQVMGDGIMALFGAPLAHEDHAVRACYAALRMQESIKRYAEDIWRSAGVRIQIRVGLNSGEVVVRSIGSDLHMDYTAVGQTTHLAARMEQTAVPGSILITAHTLDLTQGYVVTTSLGEVSVKGLQEPIQAYELVEVGAVRTKLQAAVTRGLTPFVGRTGEMAQLQQALNLARIGHGQTVALVGEPGVGKSRVLWEFARSDVARDFTLLEASCLSYGTGTPYLATIELLRSYFHIAPSDDTLRITEKIRSTIELLDRALVTELPALLSVLNVETDDKEWQELDPLHRRHRMLDAIRRVLVQESRMRPLLIIVEDLHWADSETQIVLDALVESLPRATALLLVSYRPEYRHHWTNRTYYSQLRIDPLRGTSSESLLGAILGDDPQLDPLKHRLGAWTNGNPFFVEESVRTLVETKALSGQRGSYRLKAPIIGLAVPGTLQTLVAARIDRLRAEDKYVLQIAAVIGTSLPLSLLRNVAVLPEQDLRASLGRLQTGEFLDEERLLPEEEYAFRHTVTHDVAYKSLLVDQRHDFHRRIAAVMEGESPERLSQHVAALAQHSLRGEVWDKAVTYSSQAGIQAVEQGALREAASWFKQALMALEHVPESESVITAGIDLRFGIRNMLAQYGELRDLLPRLEEAKSLALQIGDERRHARAITYIAEHFFLVGEQDEALSYGEAALLSAQKLASAGLLLEATTHLGMICHAIGQYARSAELVRPNMVATSAEGQKRRFANPALLANYSRSWLVWDLAELGLFEEAVRTGESGVREADGLEHPFYRVVARLGLGIATLRQGEWRKACGVLEEAVALSKGGGGFPTLFAASAGWLGSAYAFSGRMVEATSLHVEGIKQAAASGFAVYESLRQTQLGETFFLSEKIDAALDTAQKAVNVARDHREHGHEAWALRLLGDVLSKSDLGHSTRGESYFRDAMRIAQAHGMRPLVAHCQLGLGKLYGRTGQLDQAREHLTTATTMYREMGMMYGLDQAAAEMARLG